MEPKINGQIRRILKVLKLNTESTIEEIAELTGLGVYQVESRLKNLEELGEIKKIEMGNKILWRRNGTDR